MLWKQMLMYKQFAIGIWVLFILSLMVFLTFGGCAGMYRVESPRPLQHQTDAAQKVISDSKMTTIVGAQKDKQGKIKEVAVAAFEALGGAKKGEEGQKEVVVTKELARAVSNIAANAFGAIEAADGTQETLGKVMGKTSENILTLSTIQYAAYAAAQGVVAAGNKEKLYKGIGAGFEWTKKVIALAATGTLGGGGLIFALLKVMGISRGRKELLKNTGAVIEKFTAEKPTEGKELKTALAKGAASLPVDAKKEFDIS